MGKWFWLGETGRRHGSGDMGRGDMGSGDMGRGTWAGGHGRGDMGKEGHGNVVGTWGLGSWLGA